MENIVVITSDFMPNPDANGICAYNMIQVLKKNAKVTCICNKKDDDKITEMIEDIQVYRVPMPKHMKILEVCRKNNTFSNKVKKRAIFLKRYIRNFWRVKNYPEIEYEREKMILSILKKIDKIDMIIGIYKPYDGIGAALQYKEENPEVMVCGYFLDSLLATKPFGMRIFPYKDLLRKNDKKIIEKLDIVLKPESDKQFYAEHKILKKIKFVNFPVFVKAETDMQYEFPKEKINLVFIGTLSSQYRSPAYLLQVIDRVYKKNEKVHLHFWGKYDNLDELKKWEQKYSHCFSYYGQVSYCMSRAILTSADVLINITNKDMQMIPSKVYELMAQCKPIINVSLNVNDECEKCFGTYPIICNINGAMAELDKDTKAIEEFLKGSEWNSADYKKIQLENEISSPEYICKIIYEEYKRRENKDKYSADCFY